VRESNRKIPKSARAETGRQIGKKLAVVVTNDDLIQHRENRFLPIPVLAPFVEIYFSVSCPTAFLEASSVLPPLEAHLCSNRQA
jgi:hypothetical protein